MLENVRIFRNLTDSPGMWREVLARFGECCVSLRLLAQSDIRKFCYVMECIAVCCKVAKCFGIYPEMMGSRGICYGMFRRVIQCCEKWFKIIKSGKKREYFWKILFKC